MSPAKPEISHWGSSFSEHKFGTSDNPKTRKGKFVPVDQVPDTEHDNPEEALMRKRGEMGEEEIPEMPITGSIEVVEEEHFDDGVGEKMDFLHENAVKRIASEKARFLRNKGQEKGSHGAVGKRPAQKPVGKPQADKRRAA